MIETTKYKVGKTLCVLLVTDDGPPSAISVNLHGHPSTDVGELGEGEFVLSHNYLYMLPELLESGLVEDTGRRCSYAYVTGAPILRLTEGVAR
jgi:hypothetical protein